MRTLFEAAKKQRVKTTCSGGCLVLGAVEAGLVGPLYLRAIGAVIALLGLSGLANDLLDSHRNAARVASLEADRAKPGWQRDQEHELDVASALLEPAASDLEET